MSDNTMGLRIARQRKQLSLSQEALGDKLGVSRQAISKWESDAAVPEVDKLIALSRLFGVSVGWLLGTEPEPGTPEPEPRVLYVPRRTSRLTAALGILLAAAVLILSITCIRMGEDAARLENRLARLENDNNDLVWELSRLSDRLEQAQQQEQESSQLLTDLTWEVLPREGSPNGCVRFSFVPKTRHEEETCTVTARRGGAHAGAADCVWDGSAYTGELILAPENGYEFYVTVTREQTQNRQRLQCPEVEALGRYMAPVCALEFTDFTLLPQEGRLELPTLTLSMQMPGYLTAADHRVDWTEAALVLYVDDAEADRHPLSHIPENYADARSHYERLENLAMTFPPLQEGQTLRLCLEVALSNGQQTAVADGGWTLEEGELLRVKETEH